MSACRPLLHVGDVAGGGELVGGGGAEGRHDFPATQAASQPFPLADFSVWIRSDCVVTISALRKESFRSPALQNGALLHNRLFMDLGAMQLCTCTRRARC